MEIKENLDQDKGAFESKLTKINKLGNN